MRLKEKKKRKLVSQQGPPSGSRFEGSKMFLITRRVSKKGPRFGFGLVAKGATLVNILCDTGVILHRRTQELSNFAWPPLMPGIGIAIIFFGQQTCFLASIEFNPITNTFCFVGCRL